MRKHTLLGLMMLCGATLTPHTAKAGQWIMDHYERDADYYTESISASRDAQGWMTEVHPTHVSIEWTSQGEKISAVDKGKEVSAENTRYLSGNQFRAYYNNGQVYFNANPPARTVFPGKAIGKLRIHSVFVWQRRTLPPTRGEDGVYQPGAPDPTDNPPDTLFIREHAKIGGFEHLHQWDGNPLPYNPQNPYPGKEFTFSNIGFTLGTDSTHPVLGWNQASNDGIHASYESERYRVTPIPAGKDVVHAPACNFQTRVDLNTSYTDNAADRTGTGEVVFDYTAEVAALNISVKRKDSGLPPVSGDLQSAAIAAGQKDNDRHRVDVYCTLNPPLAGQKLLPLEPFRKGGVPGYLKGLIWEPNADSDAETDQSGRVLLGRYWSNDQTTLYDFDLSIPGQDFNPSSHGRFKQSWDEPYADVPGAQNSNEIYHWTYKHKFDYDDGVYVEFRPRFMDYAEGHTPEVPSVNQHKMNFMAGRIEIQGYLQDGSFIHRVYTSNTRELNQAASPPLVYASQAALDNCVVFTPKQASDSGDGLYTTTFVVKAPLLGDYGVSTLTLDGIKIYQPVVKQVWLKAQDEEVYEPTP